MDKIIVKTSCRNELIDITKEVQAVVKKNKIADGICFVTVPHTTAALTINENADPSVRVDITNYLVKAVPHKGNYLHSEGNSDAHIKSSLIGQSLTIFIENSRLRLGSWQGIYFVENDGPRNREVWVKFCGEVA